MSSKIAIIGAGPGGLTLARLLQCNNVACTIFEADTEASSRNQGGTLDLHERMGQAAIREANLWTEFEKHSRPEGESLKIVRKDGHTLWNESEAEEKRPEEYANRPEIDRFQLRRILLESLAPGTVQWGRKVVEIEESDSGIYNIHFQNDVQKGFRLVVGADGAWSKVRPLLTAEQPFYSGISCIEMWALEVSKKNTLLSKYVGQGSLFVFDKDRSIAAQRNGDDSIRTYALLRQPEDWIETCGIDWSDGEKAREEVISNHFNDYSPDLKYVFEASTDNLVPRSLYMLPIGMKWQHRAGVTLLGDAAHVMTPFAGIGVNLAMADALDLARALISCRDELGDTEKTSEALQKYEESMFKRAEMGAKKTYKNLLARFDGTGAEQMIARVSQNAAAEKQ